jgi:hypothetical protein
VTQHDTNDGKTNHEIDRRPAAKDMSARNDSLSTGEPFGRTGFVEGCRLGVQLHVPGVDPRPEDPWVVEVVLAGFDEQDFEVMV